MLRLFADPDETIEVAAPRIVKTAHSIVREARDALVLIAGSAVTISGALGGSVGAFARRAMRIAVGDGPEEGGGYRGAVDNPQTACRERSAVDSIVPFIRSMM